ncbi:hybrid sensor histidine kinase/response regulator [Mucilaginibacter sp. HMF5004]|uniref:hybrid sensor histidine kinase/response regulator n=1 Tax=Mucilaginibacter rivuli TaxID=2857527 RepID=UPI001C5E7742|nr:hybrid sensor histidine kinase/response regulator [Mucilaginibacter rivuli]MBW4889979.1 hybrid sensor histidine kinase/response regulator [Mucilaginibacter rivuli]
MVNKRATGGIPVKLLLVDDNENNLLSMEVALEKGNYLFFRANSGREALRILLKEEDFSLILLDVKMPIMDGYETAELIYERDRLKHIPIIFITAHDYEEAAMFKGYQTGAVDFIRKPFNPDVLRSKVAVFAELHKKNLLLRKQEEKLQVINQDLMKLNQELEQRVLARTTELETLNGELQALNLSKDKFLSVISHDLRNPLTALLASSKKLNEAPDKLSAGQVKQLSNIIHRTSNKLLDQLNELIDWAKKQSQKVSFNPESIRLIDGVEAALELLKQNAVEKNIKLKNKIFENLCVKADSLMLRSIVQNLVTNAIKYTPNGGSVIINAKHEDDMVCVYIEDSGIGMSNEVRDNLFNRENNRSVTGTNNEQGSGLGLLLVSDFVTQHGGTIVVDSTVDVGTTFKFTLPASEIAQVVN